MQKTVAFIFQKIRQSLPFVVPLTAILVFAPGSAIAACLLGLVGQPAGFQLASTQPIPFSVAAVPKGQVSISYFGHSSFLIETPGGVTAVTDFNGLSSPNFVPDIVTMNNSHEGHFTPFPDRRIQTVLRGWSIETGKMARHDLRHKDLRVFNVPTNIGEYGDPKGNGNSIFVFEISGLCIAHVGHLHHVLTKDQLKQLGRIDILFVPIDGGMTIQHEQALAVIEQVSPRMVIPMHFGFIGAAERFFEMARKLYPIKTETGATILVSRKTLPKEIEIRFLQGG
ncbi:MAG: Zn-dependent hydrolase [Alphaproteobacteria bacterium]|nr:Zn-dependent hydrolase [Alphaproteobacteria bacterium]